VSADDVELNQSVARRHCWSLNAELVSIADADENRRVSNIAHTAR